MSDMLAVTEGVREYVEAKSPRPWVVLMLHSSLSVEEQDKVQSTEKEYSRTAVAGASMFLLVLEPLILSNTESAVLPRLTGLGLQYKPTSFTRGPSLWDQHSSFSLNRLYHGQITGNSAQRLLILEAANVSACRVSLHRRDDDNYWRNPTPI